MGIACVDELASRLDGEWRAVDYRSSAFPELAERLLREAHLPGQLTVPHLVAWALETPTMPPQVDPSVKFGQPPLTLWRNARFHIDALFWVDGTTAIHQHGFSGAFQVLAGSSIEALFSFELERAFDGHFLAGTLSTTSTALLRQGDVRPIVSGPGLIHSVFHLDRPSVSIVVRTPSDPGAGPQFNYARAGLGQNPFFTDELLERKLQLVATLRTIRHPTFDDLVGDLIAGSDLHSAYRIVRECSGHGSVEALIDRVRDRSIADRFRVAVRDRRREAFLVARRGVVADPELRFFLGVLLNASRRRDVLTLAREKSPETEPARQVAAWLRRLSTLTVKLQAEGAPWQPNLLGLPAFDDEIEDACAATLGGRTTGLSDRAATAMGQLRALPALACLFEG